MFFEFIFIKVLIRTFPNRKIASVTNFHKKRGILGFVSWITVHIVYSESYEENILRQ